MTNASAASSKFVVLTGATGFVGSAVLARLRLGGWGVVAVTRNSQAVQVHHPKIQWLEWEALCEASCQGAVAVLHLATSYGRDGNRSAVYEANIAKPLRLFSTAARAGIDLFVNTDTYFARAPSDYPYLLDYRASKMNFSRSARHFLADVPGAKMVDVELEHPYGPFEPAGKFCADVMDAFIEGRETFDMTLGQQHRDFIHVDDVASAYVALLEGRDRLAQYQRLGLGTGLAHSLRDFVETVQSISGASTRPNFGSLPYRPYEIMHSCADTECLRRLGWLPFFNLRDGLQDCLQRRQRAHASRIAWS